MDESTLRLTLFLGLFVLFASAQAIKPRRQLVQGYRRWPGNLAIVLIYSLLVRLLLPAGAVGAALWAEEAALGLFNFVALPSALEIIMAVLALDLVIYWQHRLFHKVPLLWRLHRVHHADRDIDITTGLRFHPLEILISMLIKMAAVAAIGADVSAVILFEVILNGMAMFNHANLKLPIKLDQRIRLLLVTPDVHRVHHSTIRHETDSNFGFNLSLWDRLFNTWVEQPQHGHNAMNIGLKELQHAPTERLLFMLNLPFSNKTMQYPQNGEGHGEGFNER